MAGKGAGFGAVYDRGKPGKPNIWITWSEQGRKRYQSVGRVDPKRKTAAEVDAATRHLRRLADKQLADIALRVANGQAGVEMPVDVPLFRDVALDWAKDRRTTTIKHADFGEVQAKRNGAHDDQRMRKYLEPFFGNMRLDQIGTPEVWRFIKARRRAGLSGATVERLVALLSRFFNDMRQTQGIDVPNPVAALDPTERRKLARGDHDPSKTPFLRTKDQIRAVYRELQTEPHIQAAFAVGAFGGLRTGELLALQWSDIDLKRKTIRVERQKVTSKRQVGPVKNNKSRTVPINDSLLPILRAWKAGCPPGPLLFASPRTGRLLCDDTPHDALQRALGRLSKAGVDVPQVSWYQATRHTCASHWVMDGGGIEKLSKMLGHCSVVVTERYAHLRSDCFTSADLALGCVDGLMGAPVVKLRFGYTAPEDETAESASS